MLWWDKRKLTSKDGDARRKAAEKLVSTKTYAPLIEALTNDSRDVRETAVAALANIDEPGVFESLRGLLKNPNAERRRDTLLVLAKCGQGRFVGTQQPFLCEIAKNDPDRGAALAALDLLSADPCFEDVLFKAKDIEVRKSALAKMKPSDLRPAIARLDQPFVEDLARTHKSKDIRQAAVEIIKDETILAQIALKSADNDARRAALQKISRMSLLFKLYEEVTTEEARRPILTRLEACDPASASADKNEMLRALENCLELTRIERHYKSEDGQSVSDREIWPPYLEKLAGKADPDTLLAFFKTDAMTDFVKHTIMRTAETVFNAMAAKVPEAVLFESAKTVDYRYFRELAIRNLKTPEFVRHFADRAYDADVRIYALEHPNCPPDILAAAARDDPDEEARIAAIRNPNMADRAALEAYAKAESALIRENAASRLAELDISHVTDDSELEMLVDAGKDEAIRTAALKKIKDQKMLTRIALSHGDAWIRFLAADCLKDDEARFWVAVNTADPEVHRKAGGGISKDDVRRRLAHELLLRFFSGSKEEIRHAADLIRNHIWAYPTREAIGEIGLAIVNRLVPTVNYSDMGPMRGRRDTFEWLVLAYLNDTENPHHSEYLPELKRWVSRVSADKVEWAKRAGVPL